MSNRRNENGYWINSRTTLMLRLLFGLITILVCFSNPGETKANDKIKKAIKNYEARMEAERAKVIAVFERESRIAARSQDKRLESWLVDARTSWMNQELMVSERGGLRFFTGTQETFDIKDFKLSGDFQLNQKTLRGDTGNASIRMNKPAKALYFRGLVESKNNFAIHLNQARLAEDKDIAIVVGGWGNARSEIQFDGETIATKPVGMPPRWLCEVYYQQQGVTVYANGVTLMSARIPRPLSVSQASLAVAYDSETAIHQPVFKVK